MSEELKKAAQAAEDTDELELDELDEVRGGALRNAITTNTQDISDDMKKKI